MYRAILVKIVLCQIFFLDAYQRDSSFAKKMNIDSIGEFYMVIRTKVVLINDCVARLQEKTRERLSFQLIRGLRGECKRLKKEVDELKKRFNEFSKKHKECSYKKSKGVV